MLNTRVEKSVDELKLKVAGPKLIGSYISLYSLNGIALFPSSNQPGPGRFTVRFGVT